MGKFFREKCPEGRSPGDNYAWGVTSFKLDLYLKKSLNLFHKVENVKLLLSFNPSTTVRFSKTDHFFFQMKFETPVKLK